VAAIDVVGFKKTREYVIRREIRSGEPIATVTDQGWSNSGAREIRAS
jgi:hypothetical protein